MVRFWGFHSDMFNVLAILLKWLLAIFETSFFSSDVSRFFSFNVIFWSHCEPFSLKKGLQSYLISFETQFFGKSFLAFLFNLNARFLFFLYTFKSYTLPNFYLLCFLFLTYNRRQNLWNNVRKSRKIGQDKKTLKVVFA